jgi:hypothetical protein
MAKDESLFSRAKQRAEARELRFYHVHSTACRGLPRYANDWEVFMQWVQLCVQLRPQDVDTHRHGVAPFSSPVESIPSFPRFLRK